MPTESDVNALVVAMWQLLDDMGRIGQGVCLASKAQARITLEPFLRRDHELDTRDFMSLDEAKAIVFEITGR